MKYKDHKVKTEVWKVWLALTKCEDETTFKTARDFEKSTIKGLKEVEDSTGKSKLISIAFNILLEHLDFSYKYYDITAYNVLELWEPVYEN